MGRVAYLASSVPYEDGAEDNLLKVFNSVEDLSDGSDELLSRIEDWPTRSHFSPLRSNLVKPLRIEPGMRVLDVGCGSGTTLRYLGELGADVTGIEGSPARARAAAIRCCDLPNVKVVCGPIQDYKSEPYDLVLVIGVLEYSDRLHATGHKGFLGAVAGLTGQKGVLAIAIENQIGLKYLIGYNEDHLGLPWVGVEGYQRREGIRTWTRRELANLLNVGGMTHRRWLYPYPDYKHPTHIFSDRLMRRPEGPSLVDKFLRNPVVDRSAEPALVCNAAAAHRVMLGAGLGEEVANSFLLLAARDENRLEEIVHTGEAWFFSQQRLRTWRRARTLIPDASGYRLIPFGPSIERVGPGWLEMSSVAAEPVSDGLPLERLVAESLGAGDLARVKALLGLWWRRLTEAGFAPPKDYEPNPFLPPGASAIVPGNMLDANLDNFLLTGDKLVHVDTELVAIPGVDPVLVGSRALRNLAERALIGGWMHPWTHGETLGEVFPILCDWAGIPKPRPDLDTLAKIEATLQEIVVGADPVEVVASANALAGSAMFAPDKVRVPFTTLATNLQSASLESAKVVESIADALKRRVADIEELRAALDLRVSDVDELRAALHDRDSQLEDCRAQRTSADGTPQPNSNEPNSPGGLTALAGRVEMSKIWRTTGPLRSTVRAVRRMISRK